jgi:hypothetical protein
VLPESEARKRPLIKKPRTNATTTNATVHMKSTFWGKPRSFVALALAAGFATAFLVLLEAGFFAGLLLCFGASLVSEVPLSVSFEISSANELTSLHRPKA